MTSETKGLVVRSHVARDLLQSAALFKTDKMVVWEYVVNGLEYIDDGTSPEVRVNLDPARRCIVVADNGRGMDWADLQNFFLMHGENIDRKRGTAKRGFFGTGKSAAFGIADRLTIRTVRAGRRATVTLARRDIEALSSGEPVPVQTIEQEIPTSEPNGTIVTIDGIHLKTLDRAGIIRYIERHLARWRNRVRVLVNGHECEFDEPTAVETREFLTTGALRDALGDVVLTVKVAASPLDEDLRGVAIYSNGILHEVTLAGSEGREMSQFIFGDIDVPRLDADTSPIAPFDLSRSMRLNPQNDLVRAIYGFVGQHIDAVRRDLVARDKARKASEDARKLAQQAREIAQVINDDFLEFRSRIARVQVQTSGLVDDRTAATQPATSAELLIAGGAIAGDAIADTGGPGSEGGRRTGGSEPRTLGALLAPASDGLERGREPESARTTSQRPKGGFRVEFGNLGEPEKRAVYMRDQRAIYVNLDHPQLRAALGEGSVDGAFFRQLAYEIAFSEYAIALARELAHQGEFLDASDYMIEIRETIDRVVRRAARFFALEERQDSALVNRA